MRNKKKIVLAAAVFAVLASPASALVIDTFDSGNISLSAASAYTGTTTDAAGILGGERDIEIFKGGSIATMSVSGGQAFLVNYGGTSTYKLTYDGNDDAAGVGMNLGTNFLADGADRFLLDLSKIAGTIGLTLSVMSATGTEITKSVSVASAGLVQISYSSLLGADYQSVLSNAANVQLSADLGAGHKLTIRNFCTGTGAGCLTGGASSALSVPAGSSPTPSLSPSATSVPVPATLTLIIPGLAMLWRLRRRAAI